MALARHGFQEVGGWPTQEVTVAQRLLSFEVQLDEADPRKLFTE